MHGLLIVLLCSILQVRAASYSEFHIIMPEHSKELLELPHRLLSRNAEIFPDLTTINEKYQKALRDFKELGTINVHTGPWALNGFPFPCIFFFAKANITLSSIFLTSIPSLYEKYPDILSKSQQEQADTVYELLCTQEIFKNLERMCVVVQNNVRFSDAHEDRYGRLIINGVEVYRGIPGKLEADEIIEE